MNCAFDELFEVASLPFVVRELDAMGRAKGLTVKVVQSSQEWLLKILGHSVLTPVLSAQISNETNALNNWCKGRNPRIRTNSKIVDAAGLFDVFSPSAGIERIIDRYRPDLTNAIGVHIRRTDNQKSIANSPTSAFVRQMRLETSLTPDVKFFVATDSPATYAELKREFGKAIFEHSKASLDRDNANAICDAMVDLYCLSNCRKLIGSYWSSFTDTAWEIKGIEHVIIHEGQGKN